MDASVLNPPLTSSSRTTCSFTLQKSQRAGFRYIVSCSFCLFCANTEILRMLSQYFLHGVECMMVQIFCKLYLNLKLGSCVLGIGVITIELEEMKVTL